MKITGMRWGCDEGGMACGPMGSTMVVELAVVATNGETVYVTTSLFENFEHISVTAYPMFDTYMESPENIADELENAIEDYDFEITEDFSEDDFGGSKYFSAIRFARYIMEQYVDADGFPEEEAADAWIKPFIDQDTDDQDVPFVTYGCVDDDFDDDEK